MNSRDLVWIPCLPLSSSMEIRHSTPQRLNHAFLSGNNPDSFCSYLELSVLSYFDASNTQLRVGTTQPLCRQTHLRDTHTQSISKERFKVSLLMRPVPVFTIPLCVSADSTQAKGPLTMVYFLFQLADGTLRLRVQTENHINLEEALKTKIAVLSTS